MCLAKPLKLIDIDHTSATGSVDIGNSVLSVGLELTPDAKIGDWILVHAGMAIELLDAEDAVYILDAYDTYVTTGDPLSGEAHDTSV
jgi:hydrogenase expression/formation protein HypC